MIDRKFENKFVKFNNKPFVFYYDDYIRIEEYLNFD
jgi:hypothetical protein